MQFFSCVIIVLCSLFAIGFSIRERGSYRCPDNVSDEECQNYQCPPNSEIVECVNFCNTCEDGKVCIDYCLPGCNCKAGFFRDTRGACVRRAQCPKKIPSGLEEEVREEAEDATCNRRCYTRCRKLGRPRGGTCRNGVRCVCFR